MADEIFDSWEDAADSESFDRKLDEIEGKQQEEKIKLKKASNSTLRTVVVDETSKSTSYQPQIRILKRDEEQQNQPIRNKTADCTQQQQKTLAEREADYAAARARILGSTERG